MAMEWSDSIERLPHVVQLLVRNVYDEPLDSVAEMHNRVRRLLPELRRQAEAAVDDALHSLNTRQPYAGASVLNLSGPLDPFSPAQKCAYLECRIKAAQDIARFVGLYADVAYIPDSITNLVAFTDRWTAASTGELIEHMAILTELLPLVDAGVLRFSLPVVPMCHGCLGEMHRRLHTAAQGVVAEYGHTLLISRNRNVITIDPSKFELTNLVRSFNLSKASRARVKKGRTIQAIAQDAYAHSLANQAHETLLGAAVSLPTGAVNVTASRGTLLVMRSMESLLPDAAELESWEASRATNLPWIRDLSLDGLLDLRNQAEKALPRFRARMASAFVEAGSNNEAEIRKVVAGMREDAAEVEAELQALDLKGTARVRNSFGTLSITAAIYGFASEFANTVTGLLSALAFLHTQADKKHVDRARAISRPGFVLLKARDLSMHASHVAKSD